MGRRSRQTVWYQLEKRVSQTGCKVRTNTQGACSPTFTCRDMQHACAAYAQLLKGLFHDVEKVHEVT